MSEEYNKGYRKGYIDGLAAKPAAQPTIPKIDPWLYEAKRCSRCSMDFNMITGYVCPRTYCPTFLKVT
jgi:hypothetical protein